MCLPDASDNVIRDASGRELQMETLVFDIPNLSERQRVDRYLTRKIKYATRNRVQKAIAEQRVKVNGNPVKNAYALQSGDRLEIQLMRPAATDMIAEPMDLDIYYEDEDLIVVCKPPGIAVHPTYKHWDGTLANGLIHHFRQQLKDPEAQIKPGLIHRLDKNTSGLLVIGKSQQAKRRLSQQFLKRTPKKIYRAIVVGVPDKRRGLIETNLAPSPRDQKYMANYPYQGSRGKVARTAWHCLETFKTHSLLEVELFTGRTHQIRTHLAHIGHPILNDWLYGASLSEAHPLFALMPRHALHAAGLSFDHPETRERLSFDAPLPTDMQQTLEALRA